MDSSCQLCEHWHLLSDQADEFEYESAKMTFFLSL